MRRSRKGPAASSTCPGPFTNMLMGYSKNQKAAKEFLRWVQSKPIFEQWFTSQQGYTDGATQYWEKTRVWSNDPVCCRSRISRAPGGWTGYAGPPSQAAAEVMTKYIIVDMYAKAVQGMPAEDVGKGGPCRTR